jgi:O-antigen/teichoic acid export membrane protein
MRSHNNLSRLEKMKNDQLKAGVFLSYVVLALNTLVGLAYTPYMLRMMGKSEFGLYSLVISVIGYLTVLDLGFGNAIVRYTAKYRAEGKVEQQYSMFGMFLSLYTLIGIMAFLIGLVLYFNVSSIFGDTMSIEELRKARIMVLIMVFNLAISFPLGIFGSIITAYEKFIFQKVVQIVRVILNTIMMIVILEMGFRAVGMVVVVTIFNVFTLFINFIYCKFNLKVKFIFKKFEWIFLGEISVYSFYIFLNLIMDKVYWSTGQFILGAVIGTAAIAVFAVAIQLQNLYMSFSSAITGVFLPKVTAMVAMNDSKTQISEIFIKTGRIQFIVMAFILTGFILFGKYFVILWAGSGYLEAYYIALLFFVPLTVPLIQNLGITILQARNQMKFRSLLYVGMAVLSLMLQIPLAKKFGAIGIAIGISSSLVLGQIIIMNIYYHIRQGLDMIKFWKEIFKMSIVPLVLGVITYFVMNDYPLNTIAKLVIGIIMFSIIFIPMFWTFSMNQYERDLIKKPVLNTLNKK